MLRWRLLVAAIGIALFLGLAWVDWHTSWPGLVMLPLALVGSWMSADELLGLYEKAAANRLKQQHLKQQQEDAAPVDEASDRRPKLPRTQSIPSRPLVLAATMLAVIASTAPATWAQPDGGVIGSLGWVMLGLTGGLLCALVYEMRTYDGPDQLPGTIATRLSRTMFAITYAGGLMGFVVQLRVLRGDAWGSDARWGMLALLTTIAVVKCNDTGAYFAGHLWGRHRMTPKLSPGKTWEGTLGGFLGSVVATFLFLGPLASYLGCTSEVSWTRWGVGALVYAIVVGLAGVVGDLAISLLKRDAGVKDSSTWMPGFGGFLDLLDSILLAAPVSYVLWVSRVVGP